MWFSRVQSLKWQIRRKGTVRQIWAPYHVVVRQWALLWDLRCVWERWISIIESAGTAFPFASNGTLAIGRVRKNNTANSSFQNFLRVLHNSHTAQLFSLINKPQRSYVAIRDEVIVTTAICPVTCDTRVISLVGLVFRWKNQKNYAYSRAWRSKFSWVSTLYSTTLLLLS